VHFETVAEWGWFKNLFLGKQPWVEVAFVNQKSLLLNAGVLDAKRGEITTIPDQWREDAKGLWNLPLTEVEDLINWTDRRLATAVGSPNYQVSGWIEGL
jgi:hypothetical protein